MSRQVGAQSGHAWCFSMAFADLAGYEASTAHPEHRGFAERRWEPEVTAFLELDSEPYEPVEPALGGGGR